MADPAGVRTRARKAVQTIRTKIDEPGAAKQLAIALWLQAEASIRMNKLDGVQQMIAEAIGYARMDRRITKLDADLQMTRARLAAHNGKAGEALNSFHKAHELFGRLNDPRGQSIALQGLGSLFSDARDFKRMLDFYNKATETYAGDPALELSAANNRGNALMQLGQYPRALEQFQKALKISKDLNSPMLQARILMNIATLHADGGKPNAADKHADQSINLLKESDGARWLPFGWGIKARIALEKEELERALNYVELTFDDIDIQSTPAPFRDIHETAHKVYSAAGDFEQALIHYKAFKRLDDAGRRLTASRNLALATAEFDLTSKQLEIQQLRGAQLESDLELQAARARQQRLIFLSIGIIGLVAAAWMTIGYIAVRRHRNQINQANDKLMELVGDLNQEVSHRKEAESKLRVAKEEAERASHAKTQFLANMSHELRTPLNAIIGFSDIMKDEIMGPIGQTTYKEYSNDISRSGQHLLSILNDILDMARIDAGKMPFTEDEVLLNPLMQDALRMFRQKAQEQRKTIGYYCVDPDLTILGDDRLLRQIVINLVSNSMKFTGEGGTIQVDVLVNGGGKLEIRIADNGIGIPSDKLETVMQPFGQVASAYAREHDGSGLGLPIVKSLVELHDGRMSIESEEHMGTTVRVILPADRIISASKQPISEPA